jgi:hypothetical protein
MLTSPLLLLTTPPLSLEKLEEAQITTSHLLFEDTEDDTITYTLTLKPAYGDLKLNENILDAASTFLATDISAGNITYEHTTEDQGEDHFSFTLSDGINTLDEIQFDIAIKLPPTISIPFDLVTNEDESFSLLQKSSYEEGDYIPMSYSFSSTPLAFNDNFVFIGDRNHDTSLNNIGGVHIYEKEGGLWSFHSTITPSIEYPYQSFGFSVAIDGDYAVIGAFIGRSGSTSSPDGGAAYVFKYNEASNLWLEEDILVSDTPVSASYFGSSVGIYDDTIVVGETLGDSYGENSGAAYIFTRSGTSWTQAAKLSSSDISAGDKFGASVAIIDGQVLIGAHSDSDENDVTSGAAYIFTGSGTSWTQKAKLTSTDGEAGDLFSATIAFNEDFAAISSYQKDDYTGTTYIFEYDKNSTSWDFKEKITASDIIAGDAFGYSVIISDSNIFIAAPYQDTPSTNSGAIYQYTQTGSSWGEEKLSFSSAIYSSLLGKTIATYNNDIAFYNSSSTYNGVYFLNHLPGKYISIEDSNSPSLLEAIFEVSHGELSLGDTTNLTFIDGDDDGSTDGNNGAYIAFQGSLEAINAALTTLTYTPDNNYSGEDTLTVTAVDPLEEITTTETYSIEVISTNDEPSLINNNPLSLEELEEVTITTDDLLFEDPDSSDIEYTIVSKPTYGDLKLDNVVLDDGFTFFASDIASGSLTYEHTAVNEYLDGFTFTVSDGTETLDQATFSINIAAINHAPLIYSSAEDSGDEDAPLSFTPSISLGDLNNTSGNDPITLSLSAAEGVILTFTDISGLTFSDAAGDNSVVVEGSLTNLNAALATLSYTPPEDFVGTQTLDITINDKGYVLGTSNADPLEASKSLSLTFANTNDAPHLIGTITSAATLEDDDDAETFDLTTIFDDIDIAYGDSLTYLVTGNSNTDLVATDITDGELTLSFLSNINGASTITVQASDGEETVDTSFSVSLAPVEDDPVVSSAIADVYVLEDAATKTIDLSAVFDDADIALNGDSLSLEILSETNSTLITASLDDTTLSLSFAVNSSGNGDITIRATDSTGRTADDIFAITVTAVEDSPILSTPLDDVVVAEDASNTVIDIATTFFNPDTDDVMVLTFTNSDTDLVSAAISGTGTNLVGTTLTLDFLDNMYGEATITVRASDQNDASSYDEDTFTVTVNAANDAPIITGPSEQTIDEEVELLLINYTLDDIDITDSIGSIQATVTAGNGTLSLQDLTPDRPADYTTEGIDTSTLTIEGSLHDVELSLQNLVYRGHDDFFGEDSVVVTIDDLGYIGDSIAVSPLTAEHSTPITVSNVNDAPVVALEGQDLYLSEDASLFLSHIATPLPASEDIVAALQRDGLTEFDSFGFDIDVYADTAIIGAPNGDEVDDKGRAYIYKNNNGIWEYDTTLTATEGAENDFFGGSVAIYGDYAIVGADTKSSAAGAAYIFSKDGEGSWSQAATLAPADIAAGENFGYHVAINSSYVAVTAHNDDDGAGGVYVYEVGSWSSYDKIISPTPIEDGHFGATVALSGDSLVIGAPDEDVTAGGHEGAAHLFYNVEGSWEHIKTLSADDGQPYDYFGGSVDITEEYIIVGAHGDNIDISDPLDGTLESDVGAAYLFQKNYDGDGIWGQVAKITSPDMQAGAQFGFSAQIHNNIAFIGSHHHSSAAQNDGAVFLFSPDSDTSSSWKHIGSILPSTSVANSAFGHATAFATETLFVGSYQSSTDVEAFDLDIAAYFSLDDVDHPNGDGILTLSLEVKDSATLVFDNKDNLTFSNNDGDNIVVVEGSISALNAALHHLRYTPAHNDSSSDTLDISVEDDTATTTTTSLSLHITPSPDTPTASTPAPISVDEDAITSTVDLSTIFSDVDIASDSESLTFTVENNDNEALLEASITGSILSLDYLDDANGSATITVRATDDEGLYAETTFDTTVNAVNDAPSITVPSGQTVDEDSDITITGFVIADIDVGEGDGTVRAELSVTNGTLALPDTDTPAATLTIEGSLADVQASLNSIIYHADENFNGSDELNITVYDNGNSGSGGELSSAEQTITITVSPVNDAPSITVPSGQTVDEDSDITITGFVIADIDIGEGDGTVRAVIAVDNGTLALPEGATPAATLTIEGSLADVQASLDTLIYRGNENFNGSDELHITIYDKGNSGSGGELNSAEKTIAITVNAVNDAPSITVPSGQTVDEDSDLTITGFVIADIDVDEGDGTVRAELYVTNGTLALPEGAAPAATLTIEGSLADVQASLNSVIYHADENFNGSDELHITVYDNGNGGAGGELSSAEQTITITVSPVNDAPSITVPSGQTVDEDSDITITGFVIADIDVDEGDGTVRAVVAVDNGTLALPEGATPAATLTIEGSLAEVQASLDTLIYRGNENFNGSDELHITIYDKGNSGSGGELNSAEETIAITVNAVNDAPSITVPSEQTVDEDSDITITGFVIADIDVGEGDGTVRAELYVTNGTLALPEGAAPAATLTIEGSIADVQASLDTLIYRGNENFNGSDELHITIYDKGNTGNGGELSSAEETIAITIDAVNDLPDLVTNSALSLKELAEATITVDHLLYEDIESSVEYTVVSKPTYGELKLDGTILNNGDTFSAADIANNILTYKNIVPNEYLDSFTFTASDGTDTLDQATFSINVAAINHAPLIYSSTEGAGDEDAPLSFTPSISLADLNNTSGDDPVTLSLSAAEGVTLTFTETSGLTFSDAAGDNSVVLEGTLTDINAALETLSYTPTKDFVGTQTLDITVNDKGYVLGVSSADPIEVSKAISLTFANTNDAPHLIGTITSATTLEDANAETFDLATIFDDIDIAYGDSLTYLVTGNTNSDLVATDITDGELTLSFLSNINGASTITVQASDGEEIVDTSFAVSLAPVEDDPFVSDAAADVYVLEDAATKTIDLSAVFDDADIALNGDSLSIEILSETNTALITSSLDGTTLSLSFAENSSGTGEITIRATDSTERTVDDTFAITVTAVEDAPVLNTPIDDVTVDEDADDTVIAVAATFFNPDADDTMVLTVTSSDTDLVTATISGTGTNLVGTTLTLDFLDDMYGEATITVRASDQDDVTKYAEDTFTVTVNPVNDAPLIIGPTEKTVNEETDLLFINYTLDDIDITDSIGSIQATITATHGTLSLQDLTPDRSADYTTEGVDTSTLTIEGSLHDVELSLQSLVYRGHDNFFGEDNVVVTIDDLGYIEDSIAASSLTAEHSTSVTVSNVNDAPVVTLEGQDLHLSEDASLFLSHIVTPLPALEGIVTALQRDGLTESDSFGFDIDVYADTAIIGAPNGDEVDDKGRAYIYKNNNGTWEYDATLTADDGAENDFFGGSVAIYGDYAIVSADTKNGAAGAAYIFFKDGEGSWSQAAILAPADIAAGENFGYHVAINSSYVAVTAHNDDDGAGAVYIYEIGSWSSYDKIISPTPIEEGHFGATVALSGDSLVIGAPDEDTTADGHEGAVHLFYNVEGSWEHIKTLSADDGQPYDYFGGSVDITEEYIIVGAYGDNTDISAPLDGTLESDVGAAYLFQKNYDGDGIWGQVAKITSPDMQAGAQFGFSAQIHNNIAFVGSHHHSTAAQSDGAVYLFSPDSDTSSSWEHIGTILPSTSVANSAFGHITAFATETLFVGAYQSASDVEAFNLDIAAYISLDDVDHPNDDGILTLSLEVKDSAILVFENKENLTFSNNDGDNIVVVEGSISALNAALHHLRYTPAHNDSSSDTLDISVEDDAETITTASLSLNISPAPDTPTASIPDLITVDEDAITSTVDLSTVFSDVDIASDGDNLTFTVENNDNEALLTASITETTISFDYLENANGSATITVRATDDKGLYTETTFDITVNAVNDTPVVEAAIESISHEEDADPESYNLFSIFSDIDMLTNSDDLTFTVESNSNADLVTVAVDSDTDELMLTYLPDANGTAMITLKASDDEGASITDTFSIEITPINDNPVIAEAPEDLTYDEDFAPTTISLSDIFGDVDITPNDDVLTLSISSLNSTSFLSASLEGEELTLTPVEHAHGATDITLQATDSAGLHIETTFTVTIDPVNDTPELKNPIEDITVNEDDQPLIINISDLFDDIDITTDPDTEHLTIEVTSSDPSLATAEISGSEDFLTGTTLTLTPQEDQNGTTILTLRAYDSAGAYAEDSFSLTLAAVNDAPSITVPSEQTVAEDTSLAITGFDITDIDVAEGDGTVRAEVYISHGKLSLSGDETPSSSLSIEGSLAEVEEDLNNLHYLGDENFNGDDALHITVYDNSNTGAGGILATEEHIIPIVVTAVNDAPTALAVEATTLATQADATTLVIEENTVGAIATFSTADVDLDDAPALDNHTYLFEDAEGNLSATYSFLTIEENSLTVTDEVDYETIEDLTFTIRSTDSEGEHTSLEINLEVLNLNDEAPTSFSLTGDTILETEEIGTVIGTLDVVDIDDLDTHVYTILTADVPFAINADGELVIASQLDYETATSYSITIEVTDGERSDPYFGAYSIQDSYTITIFNSNEHAPHEITIDNNTIEENSAAETYIGTLSSEDLDAADSHKYLFKHLDGSYSSEEGPFTLVYNEGSDTTDVFLMGEINYEEQSTYTLTVRSDDNTAADGSAIYAGEQLFLEQDINITIVNINEAPTLSITGEAVLDEDTALTIPLDVYDEDAEGNDSELEVTLEAEHGSFSVGDGEGGSFRVHTITGSLSHINNVLDDMTYSPPEDYNGDDTIDVRVDDKGSDIDEVSMTATTSLDVTINPINDAPGDLFLIAESIDEDALAGEPIGSLFSTDIDSGDEHTYHLVDSVGSSQDNLDAFRIVNNTLEVLDTALLQAHAGQTVDLTVRATDAGGLSLDRDVTVEVKEVPRASLADISRASMTLSNPHFNLSETIKSNIAQDTFLNKNLSASDHLLNNSSHRDFGLTMSTRALSSAEQVFTTILSREGSSGHTSVSDTVIESFIYSLFSSGGSSTYSLIDNIYSFFK